jgi:hypothetical protein
MSSCNNLLTFCTSIWAPTLWRDHWIQQWTKAEHRTFAERCVAFTAATLRIFDTDNSCAADAFESIGIHV